MSRITISFCHPSLAEFKPAAGNKLASACLLLLLSKTLADCKPRNKSRWNWLVHWGKSPGGLTVPAGDTWPNWKLCFYWLTTKEQSPNTSWGHWLKKSMLTHIYARFCFLAYLLFYGSVVTQKPDEILLLSTSTAGHEFCLSSCGFMDFSSSAFSQVCLLALLSL